MPRFAGLFSLLALAALGFPPFGVFSGFIGMVLHPDVKLPGSFALVALAWLAASWYFLDLMQRLLFGKPRTDLRYKDVRETESAALALLLVLLAVLGVMPSKWFDAGTTAVIAPADQQRLFFRLECTGDLLILATTRETVYASLPCADYNVSFDAWEPLLAQPVRVRIEPGRPYRLSVEAAAATALFKPDGVWIREFR